MVYGLSGAVDMLLFYPAGRLMDRRGRRWAAVPAMALLGASHAVLPFAGGVTGLAVAAALMGLGNGLSAGLILTLGADVSPTAGRAQFLGAWRLCADVGNGGGPLLIGAVTAVASLAAGGADDGRGGPAGGRPAPPLDQSPGDRPPPKDIGRFPSADGSFPGRRSADSWP